MKKIIIQNTALVLATIGMIVLIAFLLSGCTVKSRIKKKINKFGAENVLAVLQSDYKHLFNVVKDSASIDTILKVPVKISVPGSQMDTFVNALIDEVVNSAIVYKSNCDSIFRNFKMENDRLKLSIKLVNGKYQFLVNQKPQLIHDTVPAPFAVKVPCPDVVIPNKTYHLEDNSKQWLAGGLVLLGLLLVLLIKRKKPPK